MYCNKCGAFIENEEQILCSGCGADLGEVGTSVDEPKPLPMKWHKFLVYFSLIFGAALNALVAIFLLTGLVYGENATEVYGVFPSLKTVDIVYGILLLMLAGFEVFSWWNLKGYKKNGYIYVLWVYPLNAVMSLLYGILSRRVIISVGGSEIISGIESVFADSVRDIIIAIIITWCMKLYYDKRKHLFKN